MAKRKKNLTKSLIIITALLLLLALSVGLILNFENLVGNVNQGDKNNDEQSGDVGGDINQAPGTSDGEQSGDNVETVAYKVFFNDVELNEGDVAVSNQSQTTFRIESDKAYKANFVAYPYYKKWTYKIDDAKYGFKPNVDVLKTEFSDYEATVYMPYDIMEWVLLINYGVLQEQVTLPTDINYNEPYIALEIEIEGVKHFYPIQFNLNGVWAKCVLDKDEIVFCD